MLYLILLFQRNEVYNTKRLNPTFKTTVLNTSIITTNLSIIDHSPLKILFGREGERKINQYIKLINRNDFFLRW